MPIETVPTELSPPRPSLLPEQAIVLRRCEDTIQKGLTTFFEVGDALNTIKLNHLYRATHESFDDYCRERWGIGRAYANRVIQGARVAAEMAALAPDAADAPRPSTEAHTRPLAPLPPDLREDAWDAALAAAKGGVPTGRQVLAAAQSVTQSIGLNLPSGDDGDDDPAEGAADPVEAVRREMAAIQAAPNAALPPPPETDPASEMVGWLEQMEAALLSIKNGGLIFPPPGKVRCVSGCEPVHGGREWRHADSCLLGMTLEMLTEMEGAADDH